MHLATYLHPPKNPSKNSYPLAQIGYLKDVIKEINTVNRKGQDHFCNTLLLSVKIRQT